jgi:hypothetical protein
VDVWRASFAVEAGTAAEALTYAEAVEPRQLASSNRRAALKLEKARAFAMLGQDADAVREMRQAERLSPAQVRHHPLIRELITDMLSRARREAGGRAATVSETATQLLDALGDELRRLGFRVRLDVIIDRPPSLHVQNPDPEARALQETIYAAPKGGGWWFWWSWADPISEAPRDATVIIVRTLRATAGSEALD